MVTVHTPPRAADLNSEVPQVVSPGLIATVAALTVGLMALAVPHLDGPAEWLVLAISVLPVFTTLYHRLMFARGYLLHRHRADAPAPGRPVSSRPPAVAFVIASCDEPFEVARMTFDCAYTARYSGTREIIVVDNTVGTGNAEFLLWKAYVESHIGRAEDIRVVFRHNADSAGKKPGNIDLAQRLIAEAEFVVFLDVDSSLPVDTDLLDLAVSRFAADPRLGVLQFHTVPTNNHFNRLSRAVGVAQHALRISYLMRARGGFAMFYGHNAMWRRELLHANGSWLEHYRDNVIVTEDLLKTLGVHAHGYTVDYLNVPTGEWVPSSLRALDSMWMRWTYGGFQVLCKYVRPILTAPGLSRTQRVDLATMLVGYGTTPLVYPLAFVWFAVLPTAVAAVATAAVVWLPQALCAAIMWHRHHGPAGRSAAGRLADLYAGMFLVETFILAVQIRAGVNFIAGRRQGWQVTAKGAEDKPCALATMLGHRFMVALSALSLAAIALGWAWHGFGAAALVGYAVLALIPLQLLVCLAVFAGQVQGPDEAVAAAVIGAGPVSPVALNAPRHAAR